MVAPPTRITVERKTHEPVPPPPDEIVIRYRTGSSSFDSFQYAWQLSPGDARDLLTKLAKELQVDLCGENGNRCCCQNCPWEGDHG